MNKRDVFEYYLTNVDIRGELFTKTMWIRSNKDSILFTDFLGTKLYAVFLKKYHMTMEIIKEKDKELELEEIAGIISAILKDKKLEVRTFEMWLPAYKVEGIVHEVSFVGESIGVSFQLACEYLMYNDKVFSLLYNKKKSTYMGLPLFETECEARAHKIKDITSVYKKSMHIIMHNKNR